MSVRAFLNRRFVKFGLPFLFVVVGGSFGLKEFAQLRYTFSKQSSVSRDELQKLGVKMRKPEDITLEKEYERLKTMDIDNWEQVRGPRPWEESVSDKS